jgi:hypothetical protein
MVNGKRNSVNSARHMWNTAQDRREARSVRSEAYEQQSD